MKKRNKGMFTSNKTTRGFDKLSFVDFYNETCSLQESSIITDKCIWLGVDNFKPKILAADAVRIGCVELKDVLKNDFGKPCGWIDYHIPKEVMISSRMHLNRKQAKKIGLKLLRFALKGKIV